jgi:hypothetical protein
VLKGGRWRVTAVVLFAATTTAGAFAQSQNPIPSRGERSQEPKSQAAQRQENGPGQIRGTRESPFIVETLPAPKSQEEAAHEHYEHYEKPTLDRWITYATIGLVIVTALLAVFTYFLWGATSKLVRDAKATSRRQLRAYVWEDFKEHPRNIPGGYIVSGDLKNSGATTAYNVRAWTGMAALTNEQYTSFDFSRPSKPPLSFVCNPNSTHSLTAFVILGDVRGVSDGDERLYVYGRIDYDDTFGAPHWKTFRLVFHVAAGYGNWAYCDEGNNEDAPEPYR